VKRLQRIDKEMSAEARDLFAAYIADGDVSRYAKELPLRLREDFTDAMSLLRQSDFQDLLMNYPRKPRTFLVAYDTQDIVTSSWLIRDGKGNEYKPDDYLTAFARFILANEDRIDAIRILLDRPRDWSTDALSDLRRKLAAAPERYTVENLEKAHEMHYHKALIDIISMVKHAVREQEPLLTAAERVRRAMSKVTEGRSFSDEQRRWLDRIRDHLAENLSIDRDDFDTIPIFTRSGGWNKANRVFENRLEELLKEFNEAVAV
jgi:type I restriction enzyme R subunit